MAFGAYYTGALSRLFPGTGDLAEAKLFDEIMPSVLTEALPEALVALILLLVLVGLDEHAGRPGDDLGLGAHHRPASRASSRRISARGRSVACCAG